MNRKHKMIKKYGLTLRSLRLDKDIFKQYMSNRAYYDMRTRMPKGWKKHLPMMYGFTAMNCGTNGEIPIKVRHIVLKKEVVNGFLYVKTIARYVMANRMYDYATGKIKTGGDWVEECRKLDEEVRTSPNRKSFKTESFIVDMETFECHKILWMKKEENLYKKLLTIKREPSILVTKEPTPAVNERTPLDRELFSL